MAVAAPRRRADRDEDGLRALHALGDVGGERRADRPSVAGDELVEPGLEDRDLAALQGRDLVGVLIDAYDRMAEVGEAGAGDQPDIARADHRKSHKLIPSSHTRQKDRSKAYASSNRIC